MTHQLFHKDVFVETAFERRFQATLRSALHKRSWHVIVADPGSGKTMGIREMVQATGSPAILAVTAPKNNEDEQALGDQLFAVLGLKLTGSWRTRKPKLIGHLHQFGTKLLIVDDAHDLSLEHLMFLKEITDQGRLQYDRTLEPHGGVLRFKPHDKRKTSTPHTEPRWAKAETDWDVVGALEYERNAQTTLRKLSF